MNDPCLIYLTDLNYVTTHFEMYVKKNYHGLIDLFIECLGTLL